MASVTEKPQPTPPPAKPAGEPLVDQHIRRTRRALKLIDLTAGLITLTIGVLAFLLTMAVLEHWVIAGGWSDTARFTLFGILILGVAIYSWRTFLPLLRQSINPVYAAQAIEQSSPSLKNSLLNLLLLRNRKQQMSRQVLQAVEQQAAQRLAQVPIDSAIDRSAIVRLGYLLLAITAICALYRIVSPKNLFSSAGRVLMPWSEIATPSRVQILNVTPGDAKAARGDQLQIAAEVHGLEQDEPVRLLYSTADEQIVGQEIRMKPSAGGMQFSCRVPTRSNQGGIQQDFSYWIEAGDARSPRYAVAVFARPTLVVNRLRYDYPAYTGYPSREVENTGDISAVEGTRVTLFAQANKPIKTAHVDFEADGRRDLLMNANVQEATVTFPLGLRDDRRTPRHSSYVLRYKTTEGNLNQHPPKYEIDVQPDYSPEIQLLLPEEAMLEVALNQEVNFEIEARDPDFALSQVILLGKLGEEQVLQEDLLQANRLARNHTGKFIGKLRKTPQQMGLKAGDVLEYWAAAADNRHPKANLAYSAHRKLRVIGPWQGNENGEKNGENKNNGKGQQQQNENGESGEQGEGKGQQEGQAGAGEQGNSGEGEQGEGTAGQEGGEQNENNEQQDPGESASADGPNNNTQPNNSPNSEGGDSPSDSEKSDPQNKDSDPSAGQGGDQSSDQPSKVSPEGDDDSSAFERMAEHFKEQAGEETDEQGDGTGKPKDNSDSNSDGKASEGTPDTDQTGEAGDSEKDAAREGEQSDNQEGAVQDRDSEDEDAKGDPTSSNPAPGEEASKGEQEGEGEQQQGEQSPDEKMSPEQGEAGEGEKSGEEQGTPDPGGAKQPQQKEGGEKGEQADGTKQAQPEDASEAASKANDQTESDSKGPEGGDRSGEGEKGAGQQADTEGKGGAGKNQAADDGAGKASEKGDGETGQKPGDQKQAEGKTGESSGDQKGNGSKQAQKPGETASGEANQKPTPGESASADAQPQPAGDPSNGTGGNSTPPPPGETQPGDDANLDYARKQTDLILDRLDDQLKKQEVDKNLLEKLGWTQDELRRFVDRWKNLKSQTHKSDSPDANQQLNDALRSLGLQRNRRTGYQSKISQDKLRDLRDAYRGRVPLEYQEQVNRYIKGTATAQEE